MAATYRGGIAEEARDRLSIAGRGKTKSGAARAFMVVSFADRVFVGKHATGK